MTHDFGASAGRIFDVIIIGGGINGAGIAREAALRGLSVVLVEKRDFASGTTSASTKLIHGGLRYLEHLEFGLVRESLREREILVRLAPHLIKPLAFLIPFYRDRKYHPLVVKLGLAVYDLLSYDKTLDSHRTFSRDEARQLEGALEPGNLLGAALYYDCQVWFPERLCLETILDAQARGAMVLNYTQVVAAERDGAQIRALRVRDVLSGRGYTLQGKIVVNAAGPWVDKICRLVNPQSRRKIGGTKGSHLVVPKFSGGPRHAIYVAALEDQRPFFIIPWRDYYLIGTTDLWYEGDLDSVRISEREVDYLLREARRVLPQASLSREHILYTYSGVRPLPYEEGKRSEGEVTRRHIIYDHGPKEDIKNFISVIGGKLTTYRHLAEQVVDRVEQKLGRPVKKSLTDRLRLPGGDLHDRQTLVKEAVGKFGLSEEAAHYLLALYGAKASEVLAIAAKHPELREPICPRHPDLKAQIIYALEREGARKLSDVLLRRIGIGQTACRGLDCAPEAARVMGEYFGWDKARIAEEAKDYEATVRELYELRSAS